MKRRYIDCRQYPGDIKCSVAFAADSDEELLETAVQHAVAVHECEDTPELRRELRSMLRDGTPPAAAPHPASASS